MNFDAAEYRSIHPAYLVRIDDTLILNVSEIVKAQRFNEYTEIWVRGDGDSHTLARFLDEDKSLWNRLCAASAP